MNTRDLSKFGHIEHIEASKLLSKLSLPQCWQGENNLSDGVAVEFNPNSGNVFLVDDDLNVAMLNENNKLEMFLNCSNCGVEGFASEDDNLSTTSEEGQCKECIKKEKN